MDTRRLNTRITFFAVENHKNEDGESIKTRVNKITVWTEVSKSTLKEYKAQTEETRKDTKIFLVRDNIAHKLDSSWTIDLKGRYYNIDNIEPDESSHDMAKVRGIEVVA